MALPRITVAAGIVWKAGRFLAAKRPSGRSWAGYWEFPGGKQEAGETIEQTLTREMEEELGIRCARIIPWQSIRHSYPDVVVDLHFMHVLRFEGEPSPKDGQELRWVSVKEAGELAFLPADIGVVANIVYPG